MKLIPLTKGYFTVVDDDLYPYLSQWKWHYNAGYAGRKEYKAGRQITIPLHRVILNVPKGTLVDHQDGDPLNNQRSNLRLSNHSTNAMNMRKHRGKSLYKGVTFDRGWRVQIWKDNKPVFSERAPGERWAAMIYDLNAKALFGDYARLNFTEAGLVSSFDAAQQTSPQSPI